MCNREKERKREQVLGSAPSAGNCVYLEYNDVIFIYVVCTFTSFSSWLYLDIDFPFMAVVYIFFL